MSSTHWTPSQEAALNARGGNLLLSAAAGSGKTAVLVERVIRRITDPADPVSVSELLILTFTRAAAGEMRTRIAAALSAALEDEAEKQNAAPTADGRTRISYLKKQLSLLSGADISTIDSFCQSLLRRYFYLLDIDPAFKILSDDNEIFLLQDEVLSEVFLKHYESGDSDFTDLVDLYAAGYKDTNLRNEIRRIYGFTRSMAFPDDFIRRLEEPYIIPEDATPDDIPWARPLLEDMRRTARVWKDSYLRISEIMEAPDIVGALSAYEDRISEEFTAVDALVRADTWDAWYRAMQIDIFKRLPSLRLQSEPLIAARDEVKALRDTVKEGIKNIRDTYFSVPPAQWAHDLAAARPLVRAFSRLLLDFDAAYTARKKAEGLMEFHDMEHYALKLLLADDSTPEHPVPSETALSLRKKYREIMLDEYQDTNGIQELITLLIANGANRFLVGDLKQSIYRFRQADPTIFLGKYETFSENDAVNRRIDLNLNFRSNAVVLEATNCIFGQIMQKTADGAPLELAYGKKEALYAGRKEETPATYIGGSVDIDLLDLEKDKKDDSPETESAADTETADLDKIEIEARLIASKIQALVGSGRTVSEKDGTFRPVRYGDIVILMRATDKRAGFIRAVLADAGIPALTEETSDFFGSVEIQILLSLLRVIDNPRRDLPMAAVLRSPLVGLSDESLAEIHLADPESLWSGLAKIKELPGKDTMRALRFKKLYRNWRDTAKTSGITGLLETILADTDFLSYLSGMSGSALRRAHVASLLTAARRWDDTELAGLPGFLSLMKRTEENGKNIRQETAGAGSGNAVRIMTVHKSKGLEFPIVILADTGKTFNTQDLSGTGLVHKDLGLGLCRLEKKQLLRWPTLYYYAVRAAISRESLAEEARLLYVAMTRAKDKLIIIGTKDKAVQALETLTAPLKPKTPLPVHLTMNAHCYLDWILPAAATHPSCENIWDAIGKKPIFDETQNDTPLFRFSLWRAENFMTESEKRPSAAEENNAETAEALRFLERKGEAPAWIYDRFQWAYAYPGATVTPAKLTATAAVQLAQAEKEEDTPSVVLAENLTEKETLPPDFAAPPDFLLPKKIEETGTSYGTLMHKAMEKLDLTRLTDADSVIRAVREKTEDGTFTEEESRILLTPTARQNPVSDIVTFLESPLGAEMRSARRIRKEMPFSILLPAKHFYQNCEEDEKIFLQGTIDCLLETEDGAVIIDYKTDRGHTAEELAAHYAAQLRVYAQAAETLLALPVKTLCLWSFRLGKMIEIEK